MTPEEKILEIGKLEIGKETPFRMKLLALSLGTIFCFIWFMGIASLFVLVPLTFSIALPHLFLILTHSRRSNNAFWKIAYPVSFFWYAVQIILIYAWLVMVFVL